MTSQLKFEPLVLSNSKYFQLNFLYAITNSSEISYDQKNLKKLTEI